MSESKSTTTSLDVYSSRQINCKVVFPHRIVRPLRKASVDNKEQFNLFLQDIIQTEAQIKQYIADNLKRATGKGCKNHASGYPCEYCFACGTRFLIKSNSKESKVHFNKIRDQLKNSNLENSQTLEAELNKAEKLMATRKRTQIVWPASSANAEPRTTEKIIDIVERIEREGTLPPDEAKGVVTRSPLLSIPNFDFVMDTPAEYLHSGCSGVVKKLIELTFSVGESRVRNTKRKLSDPAMFNRLMQHIKMVYEFSRRNRDLDFAVLKAQEYRNIILFYVPIVLKCIDKPAQERKVWLLLCYMIRACVLPIQEFKAIDLEELRELCHQFYELYERLFTQLNCTYNTHIISSHLIELRYHGPLTFTSAFRFESFYGEIRNSFTPGTKSTLKQIFKKILIKRILSFHCCENTIFYSNRETALEDNTLIYKYENSVHLIYKIKEVREDYVVCFKQGRYPSSFPELPRVNFTKVGIYKKGPLSNEIVKIDKNMIAGKVLKVDDFFITCPNNVLREK